MHMHTLETWNDDSKAVTIKGAMRIFTPTAVVVDSPYSLYKSLLDINTRQKSRSNVYRYNKTACVSSDAKIRIAFYVIITAQRHTKIREMIMCRVRLSSLWTNSINIHRNDSHTAPADEYFYTNNTYCYCYNNNYTWTKRTRDCSYFLDYEIMIRKVSWKFEKKNLTATG